MVTRRQLELIHLNFTWSGFPKWHHQQEIHLLMHAAEKGRGELRVVEHCYFKDNIFWLLIQVQDWFQDSDLVGKPELFQACHGSKS